MSQIKAEISRDTLVLTRDAQKLHLKWPAVSISVGNRIFIPSLQNADGPANGLTQQFTVGSMHFKISVEECDFFVRKSVTITSDTELPTPDFVEIDRQHLNDSDLRSCGYMQTWSTKGRPLAEEEGGGIMPGCGHPLIGCKYFLGLEHQAGFNNIISHSDEWTNIQLVHHPVWNNRTIVCITEVFGWCDKPFDAFKDYIDTFRLPKLNAPLFCFCSFWSDPYIGNYEYNVNTENYLSYINAFRKLGLRPDCYTLDAGWQNRQSIFTAKDTFGGDEGLKNLRREAAKSGSSLSLWISNNGPMGIAPEYIESLGLKVGSGESAAYCGSGYAVLMQPELEKLLGDRFAELAGPEYQTRHFKIDWDNDCATAPEFKEKYPTRNHVREESINVLNRIAERILAVNPNIAMRNSWWASPWWLKHYTHAWVYDSGDSEYSSLPSKDQRNSAMTHRDTMYYCILQRDKSQLPLDCFDNHEFPHALRNPFIETPAIWSDLVIFSIMRGSSYLTWMLQPEALEDWQADIMRTDMQFARDYAEHIIVHHGRMALGNPAHGEIYAFVQPGNGTMWCALRNPLPFPQEIELDFAKLAGYKKCSTMQFYPDFRELQSGKITFLSHEVKVIICDSSCRNNLPYPEPFQVVKSSDGIEYHFQSSKTISEDIRPMVCETYQIKAFEFGNADVTSEGDHTTATFKLRSPYRTRNLELTFCIKDDKEMKAKVSLFSSRYPGANGSSYAMPVTEIHQNQPGYGENKNPECTLRDGRRFFSAPAPTGGEAFFRLEAEGVTLDQLEIWAFGYEAPSRGYIKATSLPEPFSKSIPPQHPLGFPMAIKLELPQKE